VESNCASEAQFKESRYHYFTRQESSKHRLKEAKHTLTEVNGKWLYGDSVFSKERSIPGHGHVALMTHVKGKTRICSNASAMTTIYDLGNVSITSPIHSDPCSTLVNGIVAIYGLRDRHS
jgi:hypothetical protein